MAVLSLSTTPAAGMPRSRCDGASRVLTRLPGFQTGPYSGQLGRSYRARTEQAARQALTSLRGVFSLVNALNEKFIALRVYVEAAIDFPEEDIDFLAEGKVTRITQRAAK